MKSIAKRLRLLIGTIPRLEEEASIIIDSRRCLMEHRLKVLRFDAQRKARPSERVAKHEHRYHVRRLHQSFFHHQKLLVSSSSFHDDVSLRWVGRGVFVSLRLFYSML